MTTRRRNATPTAYRWDTCRNCGVDEWQSGLDFPCRVHRSPLLCEACAERYACAGCGGH